MNPLISKFISRKFLVTVGTIGTAVHAHQYTAAGAAAVAYLLAQGIIDARTVSKVEAVAKEAVVVAKEVTPIVKAVAPASVAKEVDAAAAVVTTVANDVTKTTGNPDSTNMGA